MSAPSATMLEAIQNAEAVETVRQSPVEITPDRWKHESEHKPLNPEEFRSVLRQLDQMGLTWTSDLPPDLVAKDADTNGALASEKLQEIQNNYPMFPNELGYVIWYALTGTEPLMEVVGTEEDLRMKSAIVRECLITPGFRDEFLFKHMLKVPYFSNLDWEVIVKTSERGVQAFPGNAYALVSVLLESNLQHAEKNEHFTFAINEQRLETLIALFGDMRAALQKARQIGDCLNQSQENLV